MGAKLVSRVGAATLIMVLASCTSPTPHANGVLPGAHVVGGGCGSTTLYRDASQPWASTAQGPSHLVQATGHGDQVTAFIFGYPLRAGDPQDRSNKILWVVRTPRDGSDPPGPRSREGRPAHDCGRVRPEDFRRARGSASAVSPAAGRRGPAAFARERDDQWSLRSKRIRGHVQPPPHLCVSSGH